MASRPRVAAAFAVNGTRSGLHSIFRGTRDKRNFPSIFTGIVCVGESGVKIRPHLFRGCGISTFSGTRSHDGHDGKPRSERARWWRPADGQATGE